jgi:hypothetical protein
MLTRAMLLASAATVAFAAFGATNVLGAGGGASGGGQGGPGRGGGLTGQTYVPYQGQNFSGFACKMGHSNPGAGDHNFTIKSQRTSNISATDRFTGTWQGTGGSKGMGMGGGGGVRSISNGFITESHVGGFSGGFTSYTISFSFRDNSGDINTYIGTLVREGVDGWYLSGQMTVINPKTNLAIPGMGPGISSCIWFPSMTIPEPGM